MNDYPDAVRDALQTLDGSEAAAVSLITGLSKDEITDLGGTGAGVDGGA